MIYKECKMCDNVFEIGERGRKLKLYCSKKCKLEHLNEVNKEKRIISKQIGNCTICNKQQLDSLKHVTCNKCRERGRKWNKKNERKNN